MPGFNPTPLKLGCLLGCPWTFWLSWGNSAEIPICSALLMPLWMAMLYPLDTNRAKACVRGDSGATKNKHALSVRNTKLHNEGGRPLHRELQEYGDTSRPCNFMWKRCEQQYWSMPESRYALVCATREWTLPSLVWKACLQRVTHQILSYACCLHQSEDWYSVVL